MASLSAGEKAIKLDVGQFLKAAASIATGQIAGELDAQTLYQQRQQQLAEHQLRQFQEGANLEEKRRQDRASAVQQTLKLGPLVQPEDQAQFYQGGTKAYSDILNEPSAYSPNALQGLGSQGWHLPTTPYGTVPPPTPNTQGQTPNTSVSPVSAGTYPSPLGLDALKAQPAPGPAGGVPPAGFAPSPVTPFAATAGAGPPPTGPPTPTTAPAGAMSPGGVAGGIQNSVAGLQASTPYAPRAGAYAGALGGQQDAMAAAGRGAAALATGSGSPGGGTAAPPFVGPPSAAGAPGQGPPGQAGPGQAAPSTVAGPGPVAPASPRLEQFAGAMTSPAAPAEGPATAGAVQAAQPGFTPPWGGPAVHFGELAKGQGKEIFQKVSQISRSISQLDMADPESQTWLRKAQADDLGREPQTRAEYQQMAKALREYQMAAAGRAPAVSRVQLTEGQQFKKSLADPANNAQTMVQMHDSYLQRYQANPTTAGADVLGNQKEFPLMQKALKNRDDALAKGDQEAANTFQAQADDYAGEMRATFAGGLDDPRKAAMAFANFWKAMGRASPESFTLPALRNMIKTAGLENYYKDVPDDMLKGSLFGAYAEKLTDSFYQNMPKLARLSKEDQARFANRVNNLIEMLGPGGPAVKVPSDIVLQLTPAEQARLYESQERGRREDKRLEYTGDALHIRAAHERMWRSWMEEKMRTVSRTGGVTANQQILGNYQGYRTQQQLFLKSLSPTANENYQQKLDAWDQANAKDPNNPNQTNVPPPRNTHSERGLYSAWWHRKLMDEARQALTDKINTLSTGVAGRPGPTGQAGAGAGGGQAKPATTGGLPPSVSTDQYSFDWARKQGRNEAFILKLYQQGMLHP